MKNEAPYGHPTPVDPNTISAAIASATSLIHEAESEAISVLAVMLNSKPDQENAPREAACVRDAAVSLAENCGRVLGLVQQIHAAI